MEKGTDYIPLISPTKYRKVGNVTAAKDFFSDELGDREEIYSKMRDEGIKAFLKKDDDDLLKGGKE